MPFAAGTHLGRYESRSLIGAGGVGEVYFAQDTTLRRPVALKVLPSDLMHNKKPLRRFEQEALAASSLNHPDILTIYEVGPDNGTSFIATESVDGVTLRQHMSGRAMKITEMLDFTVQTQHLGGNHSNLKTKGKST